ncbi:MAG: hypothetical protein ACR2GN_00540 [Bacteroidia bacterium]
MYYKLWVDAIYYEKKKHGHFRNWKPYVLIGISFCQGLNLATILFWISPFTKTLFFIPINLFPGNFIDNAISGFITLFLPFLIINYILIFYNKKYEIIINNYQDKNGKIYIGYFVISAIICFVPIVIGFLINRLIV